MLTFNIMMSCQVMSHVLKIMSVHIVNLQQRVFLNANNLNLDNLDTTTLCLSVCRHFGYWTSVGPRDVSINANLDLKKTNFIVCMCCFEKVFKQFLFTMGTINHKE